MGNVSFVIQYLRKNEDKNIDLKKVENELNLLREEYSEISSNLEACISFQDDSNHEINEIQIALEEEIGNQHKVEYEISKLRNLYLQNSNNTALETIVDPWLLEQENQISTLDKEINKLYRARTKLSEKLKTKNDEFEKILTNILMKNLSPLFSHFASKFLGTKCELVIDSKKVRRKPVSFMYPRFFGKDRNLISRVSNPKDFSSTKLLEWLY